MTENNNNHVHDSVKGRLCDSRYVEIVTAISAGFLALMFALLLEPVRTGDGQYYFAMLYGIANHLSPAIGGEVMNVVGHRFDLGISEMLSSPGSNGQLYALHFFWYPLISVPAYKVLETLGVDTLKTFQLVNGLILSMTLAYALVFSGLCRYARWFISLGFLFSAGVIYFQWMHPEIYTASLVLLASVCIVEKKYLLAIFLAALGSLQNPSVIFLALPAVGLVFLSMYKNGPPGTLSGGHFRPVLHVALALLPAFVPYAWNFERFGTLSPIAADPLFIDYSNINPGRFFSFLFDLNQGLIIGLPLLIWAVPVAGLGRLLRGFRLRRICFNQSDILLLGFILMVLPVLAQANWNAGQSIFLRYASWSGMAVLVWVSVVVSSFRFRSFYLVAIPALTLQLGMLLYMGGIEILRHPGYLDLKPWVKPLWEQNPHIYNPEPEIFFERVNRREEYMFTPVILRGESGEVIRALTRHGDISSAATEICGYPARLMAMDGRMSSQPRIRSARSGFYYISGRFFCDDRIPVPSVVRATGSPNSPFVNGWANPEQWGIWSDGGHASLEFKSAAFSEGLLQIGIVGHVYLNEFHRKQRIEVYVGEKLVDAWTVRYPSASIEKVIVIDEALADPEGRIRIDFRFPDAVSPKELRLSDDSRRLGLGLEELKLGFP